MSSAASKSSRSVSTSAPIILPQSKGGIFLKYIIYLMGVFSYYLRRNQTTFAVIAKNKLCSLRAPPFLKSTNIPGNGDMTNAAIGQQ